MLGGEEKELACFRPGQPREKWNKKRTSVKLKVKKKNKKKNCFILNRRIIE